MQTCNSVFGVNSY